MKLGTILAAFAGLAAAFAIPSDPAAAMPAPARPNRAPARRLHPAPFTFSWSRHAAFEGRRRRKYWEEKCQQAGCFSGIIHRVHTEHDPPYVDLERRPYMMTEHGRKVRVYEDGTYLQGWSEDDQRAIARARQSRTSGVHRVFARPG